MILAALPLMGPANTWYWLQSATLFLKHRSLCSTSPNNWASKGRETYLTWLLPSSKLSGTTRLAPKPVCSLFIFSCLVLNHTPIIIIFLFLFSFCFYNYVLFVNSACMIWIRVKCCNLVSGNQWLWNGAIFLVFKFGRLIWTEIRTEGESLNLMLVFHGFCVGIYFQSVLCCRIILGKCNFALNCLDNRSLSGHSGYLSFCIL